MTIAIRLAPPWPENTIFPLDELRKVTWLVGPNGTGKSRFLQALREHPELKALNPRLLSADRLGSGRESEVSVGIWGRRLQSGLQKTHLQRFVEGNHREGAIVGTIALLYRRPDLRIRVEATLSQLLRRQIRLEMIDGNIVPKVRSASHEYSMFSDECHGVLELLVILANSYDDETNLLLIDEPELNLHPQYQAFVLDELAHVRKKVVLATHSPSFLAVKSLDDLRGVICFHPDFRMPTRYTGADNIDAEVGKVLPRMAEQHRSFFFADSPVFVEGHFDVSTVTSLQRALGRNSEAAGSCVIPCDGKHDAGRYLLLCNALGKNAMFVFDLDALFDRRLRIGAAQSPDLVDRIAATGHGRYDELAGKLQRSLSDSIDAFQAMANVPPSLHDLQTFLATHSGKENLEKRRVAMLVAMSEKMPDLKSCSGLSSHISQANGYLRAVLDHLASVGVHVLPGGAMDNYLPSYKGNRFKIPDDSKRSAAEDEQAWLATKPPREQILARYGELAQIVEKLPAREAVDIKPTLKRELAHLLHHLIMAIREERVKEREHIESALGDIWRGTASFIGLVELTIRSPSHFSGVVEIADLFGIGVHRCYFDHTTQSNDPTSLALKATEGDTVAAPSILPAS